GVGGWRDGSRLKAGTREQRGHERLASQAIPTISCININPVPQWLGQGGPIWYRQGHLPTATHDRPQLLKYLRRWRYFADELFRQDQCRDRFRARFLLHRHARRAP